MKTMLLKANLFVEKNPKIQKTTMQILKRMELISSKHKHTYIMNGSSSKENSKDALDKNKNKNKNILNKKDSFGIFHENLKDTPIYVCIYCERFFFFQNLL
jgi:aspartate carbamoyltransferase regulatory subunit